MSRYKFTTQEHTIIIGWDEPLHTYFAQVWECDPESEQHALYQDLAEPEPVIWTGTGRDEVHTLDALAASLAPYGQIPLETRKSLRRDYVRSHGYDVDQISDNEVERMGTFLEGYWPSREPEKTSRPSQTPLFAARRQKL